MSAAIWASGPDAPGILAYAAAEAPPPLASEPPADVLLQALALRFTRGYPTAAPHLTKALDQAREAQIGDADIPDWLWLAGNRASGIIAVEVWDFDTATSSPSGRTGWHARPARSCNCSSRSTSAPTSSV
jgi:hypothetical protein